MRTALESIEAAEGATVGTPPLRLPGPSPRLLVLSDFGSEASQLLERLVRAAYTPMLTSSVREALRLANEHRPVAVLCHMRNTSDYLDLANQLQMDVRTRGIPALEVRHGWKPT